jgi:hypothetical protein
VVPVNASLVGLITPSGDNDFFKITTVSPNTNLQLTLTNLPADYDLYLKNTSGTNLATSANGGLTNELIKYNTTSAATYIIRVFGYSGANNATQCYNLNIQASSTPFRTSGSETSISTDEVSVLKVYPNPANDILNLEFNSLTDAIISISVTDLVGKTVLNAQKAGVTGMNNFEISLKDLNRGVYFVEVNNGVNREIKKIVVNK